MKESLPFENGEIDRIFTAASEKYGKNGKLKNFISEEIYNEKDDKYYIYKLYTNKGKTKIIKEISRDETIFD